MLTDLLKVDKRVFEALADGGHTTKRSTLERLALEERLAVFEQADVIAGHCLDQVFGGRELTKRNPEVVGIVESVQEILVKRVDVLEARETVKDGPNLFAKGFGGIFDLADVERYTTSVRLICPGRKNLRTSNSGDLEASSDLRWESSLGATEDNVEEFLRSRHRRDILPCRLHLDCFFVRKGK